MSSPTATPKEKKNSEEHSLQLDQNDVEYNNDYSLQKSNTDAVLNNPLYGLTRAQLFDKVEKFAADKNLSHEVETLKKGALVAQNPADFRSIDILTDEERDVIDHEYKNKWAHPLTLYATIFLCSVGAATQGWDQTGSNGANLSFPTEFGISDAATLPDGSVNTQAYNHSWIVGLVNAAPYIASAFLGCWLSDPLNQYFGRRGTIFITALILVITPICSGLTQNWYQLFIVRLLLGIGMGAKGSTVPVFAAENSPTQIRGALVMSWQIWTAFGIFLGFAANVIVADTGKIAWRLQLGSAFIPALPLALFIFLCPESPRWLMRKNRYPEAFKSLCRLRFHKIQAARDLFYISVQLEEESKIMRGESYISRFTELFTIPRVRRATVASGVVMLAQQMCGINIIAFYSSTVFKTAGFTERNALYASLGFGALNWVFALPGVFTIDTFGRRSLLLVGFPIMALMLLICSMSFLAPNMPATPEFPNGVVGPGKLSGIAIGIYLFACVYSFTEGPVPFTYSAEVFPLAQREQGMAWAVATCLFWAAVLSITFPAMLNVFQPFGAILFYAGLNIIAFCLLFCFMPETKQLSLEELDAVFNVPTGKFLKYQFGEVLPWFFKGGLFRKNVAKPEPLMHEKSKLGGR
ncbi:unnamed protein product [Tilletia controversa]|uniref:Major facilitator superfamily (MFS) profile domain-containing protein n=2 Tax=Tilletia TaxID=13289 RepID=A0A177U9G4_9BASI|nr:hypothetical protein CF336_g3010 [Tilletia laevis]KAE8259632.1 hypothetical protein A4X03_0g4040 [Tilletia caries]CAD6931378.1 unnamed protein product [Tilletia controversa]KAE8204376.1 hypothetical protein CF335_g2677 [Tilletia laevis]CAD6890757.1 unnamed protein product [Tilletia caries]